MNAPFAASCVAASLVVVASCGSAPPPSPRLALPANPPPLAGPSAVAVSLASVGIEGEAIDRGADPCHDFYRFACGAWLDRTTIPDDKPSYARSFTAIADRTEADLRQILEDAAAGKIVTPAGKKVGAYYSACMDEAAVEKNGLSALEPLRKLVRAVHDETSLALAVAALHAVSMEVFFAYTAEPDFKHSERVIGTLDQGGLTLPELDFYLRDDDKSKEIRAAYLVHVERAFVLAGASAKEARATATDVVRVETALAKIAKPAEARRDPKSLYHLLDRESLVARARTFRWATYLDARGQSSPRDLNVVDPAYVAGLDALLSAEKPEAIRHYLDWHILDGNGLSRPKKLDQERFSFVKLLTGQTTQSERWKRCIDATERSLDQLVAQPYLAKRFDEASKATAEQMVGALREAFADEIASLSWMDAKTRERAARKLQAITFLVGYPAKWRTYDFDVDPKSFGADVLSATRWDVARQLAKIGPVDKEDWAMSPLDADALADPQRVMMVFPAGILQPPFFRKTSTPAVNLGAIGMVIGHELTHHFDDRGAEFTEKGDMENWWLPGDHTEFEARAACVADQYGAYEVAPGLKVNGRQTLGENIADIGGLKLAFAAYRKLRAHAAEPQIADGFTEDQQFFLSFAQAWCTNARPEIERTSAQSDDHSPPRFRVNGSVSDTPAFAEAFRCAEGAPMRPAKRCEVW